MDNIKVKVYGFIKATKKQFLTVEIIFIFFFLSGLIFSILYYDKPAEEYTDKYDIFMAKYSVFIVFLRCFSCLWDNKTITWIFRHHSNNFFCVSKMLHSLAMKYFTALNKML